MAEIKEEVLIKIELEQNDGQFKKLADLKNTLLNIKQEQDSLKKAFKDGAITQKEYADEVVRLEANQKKINAAYSETQKQITGLKSPFDKLSEGLEKQNSTLTSMAPALGNATSGFVSMGKAIYAAFIANPITAIVIGLVAAITGLVKIFTQTEAGGDLLAKRMDQIGAVFSVIMDRAGALGGAIVKLFSGDFKGAAEDAKNAFSGIGDEMLREAEIAGKLAEIIDELGNRELDYKVAASQTENQIKALVIAAKNRSLSEEERIKLLNQATDLEVKQNAIIKKINEDKVKVALEKLQIDNSQLELQREKDESELDFAKRIFEAGQLNEEARGVKMESLEALGEAIIVLNQTEGESLNLQEKINNQIDANIEKQEAKRLKTIELMAKEDEKNKKDADEIIKRIAHEDALEVKLNENRLEKETKDEAARTKEIMGDMLVGNNKLLLAKQEQDIAAKIAEQDEIDRNKKLEGWGQILSGVQGYLSQIFNVVQGSYKVQENELAVTLANQKTELQTAYAEEVRLLEDKFAKGEISKEEYDAAILGANQRYQASVKTAEIDQAKALNEIKRKEFEANKKQSIIDAGIAAAQAILKSFVQLGWPLGLAPAAAMGVIAAFQIKQIKETEFVPTAFADGGKVLSGQRIGSRDGRSIRRSNGDNLLATVKTGEVILNERHQAMLGGADTFRRIGVPGFALSGLVTDSPSNVGATNLGVDDAINRMVGRINSIKTVLVVQDYEAANDQRIEVADKAEL